MIDWAEIGKGGFHPTKRKILDYLDEHGEAAPVDMANAFDMGLSLVSYHVKELAETGSYGHWPEPLIVVSRTEPRRGATKHYYVLSDYAKLKEDPVADPA